MLERKIVRLIIMSNISRRQFLKGAGAAGSAVFTKNGTPRGAVSPRCDMDQSLLAKPSRCSRLVNRL